MDDYSITSIIALKPSIYKYVGDREEGQLHDSDSCCLPTNRAGPLPASWPVPAYTLSVRCFDRTAGKINGPKRRTGRVFPRYFGLKKNLQSLKSVRSPALLVRSGGQFATAQTSALRRVRSIDSPKTRRLAE